LVVDDVSIEGNETFNLTLSDVSNANLGSPATATVTIVDNDKTRGRRGGGTPRGGRLVGKRALRF